MSLLLLLKPKPWFWNITAADIEGWKKRRHHEVDTIEPLPEIVQQVEKVAPALQAQALAAQQEEEALLLLLLGE